MNFPVCCRSSLSPKCWESIRSTARNSSAGPTISCAERAGLLTKRNERRSDRATTKQVEINETTLPADATVFVLLGSANRDEQKFSQPDRFDLHRDNSDHLAFGFNNHYCLGAQLARLEARVALEELLFSCPTFVRGTAPFQRFRSVLLRGLQSLPLRFTA